MDGNVMEKASAGLGLADRSRQNFRRTLDQLQDRASSVLLLTLQWKDVEEQFDFTRNFLEERAKEVQAMEESVRRRILDLEKKEERLSKVEAMQKEFESIRESIKEKLEELEKKEKEFDLKQREEIKKRKEEIEMMEKSWKQLESVEKSVEEKLKEFEKKTKDLDSIKKSTEDSFKELKTVEESIRKEREELALNLKQLKSCAEDFEMKRKLFGEGSWDFKSKKAEPELKFKEKNKEFELKEKKLEEWAKGLELKDKDLEEKSKEQISARGTSRLEFEPLVSWLAKHVCASVPMDASCSPIHPNENRTTDSDDLMMNKAGVVVQILSLDPAKLVLDAVEGSYGPYLKKSGEESDGIVAIRSCVVLLEKLMMMNPKIEPEVKKQATELGTYWVDKVAINPENEMEVLGCLLFLAVYRMASNFTPQVIFKLLERFILYDHAPKLFQILGIKNKVSGVVETLIEKEEYFAAIKFICEFRIFSQFTPATLLYKYLNTSKKAAQRIAGSGNSPEVKKAFREKRKADAVVALSYIKEKKLEKIFPVKVLENLIASLEKQLASKNAIAPTVTHQEKPVHQSNVKCLTSSSGTDVSATVSAIDATIPSEQQGGAKRHRTTEPMEVAPSTSLQDPCQNPTVNGGRSGFLPSQVKIEESKENHQPETIVLTSSLNDETKPSVSFAYKNGDGLGASADKRYVEETDLSHALQCAPEPAKLVLDTVMVLYPSNLQGHHEFKLRVSPDKCFLLLDQLKNLSPMIEDPVKDAAKKLAISWKSKLLKNKSDQLEVICFLQFLGIFKVVSEFKAEELLAFLDDAHWRTVSPDLCQFLGLANDIPSFIQNLIKTGQRLKAINYIYALDIVERFPPVPILNDFLSYTNESAESSRKNAKNMASQVAAINRQIKALRDAVKCITHHKLESQFLVGSLRERIKLLFKQRSELKPQPDGAKPENKPDSSNPPTQKTNPNSTNPQTRKRKPDSTKSQTQKTNPGSTSNPQTQKRKPDSTNPLTQKTRLPDSTNPQTQKTKPDSGAASAAAAAPSPSEASSASKPKPSQWGTSSISEAQQAKETRRGQKHRWGNEQTPVHYSLSANYSVASHTSNYYHYNNPVDHRSSRTVEEYNRDITRNYSSGYSYLHRREPPGHSLPPYYPYNPPSGNYFPF